MVTVHFKLRDAGSIHLHIAEPQPSAPFLLSCAKVAGITLGGYIAVREGKVLTAEDEIKDNDTVDVFPALSGG